MTPLDPQARTADIGEIGEIDVVAGSSEAATDDADAIDDVEDADGADGADDELDGDDEDDEDGLVGTVSRDGERSERGSGLLIREGDIAGDYLEQLLDILDFDGDIDLDVEGDRAVVAVLGDNLRSLIGPRGATLEALQELTRLAVLQQTGVRSRLMLDVGGYRARRRSELTAVGKNAAERVREQGDAVRLEPMTPFERKVVHDAVAAISGVYSESEGEEPERRVVVHPAE